MEERIKYSVAAMEDKKRQSHLEKALRSVRIPSSLQLGRFKQCRANQKDMHSSNNTLT